jgi:L-asparagine oxygenase
MIEIPHCRLSPEESWGVRNTCKSAIISPNESYDRYASSCLLLAESASFAPITNWLEETKEYGLGLLSGLKLDSPIPPTPRVRDAYHALPVADGLIGGVASTLGNLYTIAGKANPKHIHDVYFIPEDAQTQLGTGCSYLQWHVEDGCHATRPDWVILLCLRGGPDVVTSVARCNDMTFSSEERTLLGEMPIYLRLDDSFTYSGEQRVETTILTETRQGLEIVYDPAYTEISTESIKRALSVLEREAEHVKHDVTMRVGDLLVFNNRRVIHSRSSFDPSGSSRDRWIKRALVLTNSEHAQWVSPGIVGL